MKKILVSLLAILLLLSMVCVMATSCKDKNPHKVPTPDEPDDPDTPSDTYDPSDKGTYMRDAVGVTIRGTDIRVGYDFLPASDYATRGSNAGVDQSDLNSLRDKNAIIAAGRKDVPVYGIYAGAPHE